jgi:hypothetical protein
LRDRKMPARCLTRQNRRTQIDTTDVSHRDRPSGAEDSAGSIVSKTETKRHNSGVSNLTWHNYAKIRAILASEKAGSGCGASRVGVDPDPDVVVAARPGSDLRSVVSR